MERLSGSDLKKLLSCLRDIYSLLDPDGFMDCVVSSVPELIYSEWTAYNEVDLKRHRVAGVMRPDLPDTPGLWEAFEHHIHEQPLVRHYRRSRDVETTKISDFLTRRQFHRLGIYAEFYRKLEVEHQMAVVLPAPRPLVLGVALNRRGRDFSERDRLILNLLRPHLVQAHANVAILEKARRESSVALRALEETYRGVVYLSRDGRFTEITERGERLLAEYFGRSDRLPEDLIRWVRRERAALSRTDDAPPPPAPLVARNGGRKLVARLVHGPAEGPDLIILEEREPPPAEDLGLTRREAEVLHLVARGLTNEEIAKRLYVSPLTVKKHLEHVYRKLGVHGRAQAVARAALVSS
jgi:DNA-binding CsgD family transcriptional regulator